MPYRRKYAKKSKKMTVRRAAGQLLDVSSRQGVKYLKRKLGLNTETKFVDTLTSGSITTTLTLLQNPMVIPQGDTEASRDGSNLRCTSVISNMTVNSVLDTNSNILVRIIAVYTPLTNANVPAVGDVLTGISNIRSHYSRNFSGYNIVFDKTFRMSGSVTSATQPQTIFFKLRQAILDHQCEWEKADTTGARTAMVRGDYAIYGIQEGATVSNPAFNLYSRTSFVDN